MVSKEVSRGGDFDERFMHKRRTFRVDVKTGSGVTRSLAVALVAALIVTAPGMTGWAEVKATTQVSDPAANPANTPSAKTTIVPAGSRKTQTFDAARGAVRVVPEE